VKVLAGQKEQRWSFLFETQSYGTCWARIY